MTILDEIAAKTRERVREHKEQISLSELRKQAESLPLSNEFPFREILRKPGMSFICEVKKASPSKGVIAAEFPYLEIAKSYQEAGAAAISCLTEPHYFQGEDRYLKEIAEAVSIPVLRKDFVVDAYMIYEAKILGAAAVLLICAILNDSKLKEYTNLAHSLGLSVLVEAHTEEEVFRAMNCGAKIIGVNNRDLKTFQVDLETSIRLRNLVPCDYQYVSESGIRGGEDVKRLESHGIDGVLIGEALMLAPDKKQQLKELRGTTHGAEVYEQD